MEEKQLGEALNALYDMEKANYQTSRMIRSIKARCDKLRIPKKFETIDTVFWTSRLQDDYYDKAFGWGLGIIAAIFFILLWNYLDDAFNINPHGLAACAYLFVGFTVVGILTMGVAFLGGVLGEKVDHALYEKQIEALKQAWIKQKQVEIEKQRRAIESDKKRLAYEEIVYRELKEEEGQLSELLRKDEEAVLRMYNAVGIGNDYRKLIPMRYMSDYFNLGISRHLDGTDGLYFLVRKELRADQFNASLQEISNKLDTLINKQSDIYRELCDMNRNCQELITNLIEHAECVASVATTAASDAMKAIAKNNTKAAEYIASRIETTNSYLALETFRHYAC